MNKRWIALLVVVLLATASTISTTAILAGEDQALQAKLTAYEAKLAAMVEQGKLTQEQADEKLEAFQSELSGTSSPEKKTALTYEALEEKLAAMVERGELTQEQADEKLKWLLSKTAAKGSSS